MQSMVKKAMAVATLAAAVASVAHAADGKWYDDMKIKGDMRYRFQQDDTGAATSADRSRNRIRVRVGAYGKVNDVADYGIRFATGNTTEANSTNQSLDSGFNKYNILLDQAYVNFNLFEGAKATAGKMNNPFYAPQGSQLIWDGDINPEGLALCYANKNFFANGGYLTYDGDTKNGSQSINALQLGAKAAGLTVAGTYYLSNSEPSTVMASGNAGKNNLTNGSDMFDINVQYEFPMGSSVKGAVYADYLANTDKKMTGADKSDSYLVGFNLKTGELKAGVAYLVSGDNGVSGLQDSDFNGGEADSKGYKIGASYGVLKNTDIGLTYFDWESATSTAKSVDKSTIQADLAIKF